MMMLELMRVHSVYTSLVHGTRRALFEQSIHIRMVDPIVPNNRIESTGEMGETVQNDNALVLLLRIYALIAN